MARPASGNNFTIAQLQRVLQEKQTELDKLHRQRGELQKKMNLLDRQIERVGGGITGAARRGAPSGSSRAKNASSLLDTLEQVFRSAGKSLTVSEILDAVVATGYKSGSANFRGIINQTLIKDKRFGSVDRGVYELKAGGKKEKKSAE